jgi:hypothetical protein
MWRTSQRGRHDRTAHGWWAGFEALRRAIERSDADSLTGFYTEDAEMLTVNRNTTPSSPQCCVARS